MGGEEDSIPSETGFEHFVTCFKYKTEAVHFSQFFLITKVTKF